MFWIIFIGAVIFLAIFIIIKLIKKKKAATPTTPTGSAATPASGGSGGAPIPPPSPGDATILKRGDTGEIVRKLQTQINVWIQVVEDAWGSGAHTMIEKIAVDGNFGQATEDALRLVINKPAGSVNEVNAKIQKFFIDGVLPDWMERVYGPGESV